WKQVTFGLGKYKSLDVLRNLALIAETSATARAEFLRYHLNVWIEGVTAPWLDPATYDDEQASEPFTLDDVAHLPCYIGIDAGQTDDLTCVSAVFHDEEADTFYVVPTIWCPAESI